MDARLFTDQQAQWLVPLADGDVAFLPPALPPDWQLPISVWPRVAEAKYQIGLLEGVGRRLPNPTLLLRPLADREALQSSTMEGTTATPRELLLFELDQIEPNSESDPHNAWLEVLNYRRALEFGIHSELPLCKRLIQQLHKILLTGVRGSDRRPGEIRRIQVALGSSRRFVPPPPVEVVGCLDALERYIHRHDAPFDAIVDCFLAHYQFEAIHPFVDGNGRVGRLLLSLMLKEKCGLSKPWLYLSDFFERHRDEYVQGLFEVSTRGRWQEWIEFCLQAVTVQTKETIKRCEALLDAQERCRSRLKAMRGSVRLHQIVDALFETPYLQIPRVATLCSVQYNTAKRDLQQLVAAGILEVLADISPRTFFAPDIFAIAYGDLQPGESSEKHYGNAPK